jgi:GxxExxY protein
LQSQTRIIGEIREIRGLTYEIIGAAMELQQTAGPGYIELIYKNALIHELHRRSIETKTECEIRIVYKERTLGRHRLDLVVSDTVIVELKAVTAINDVHMAQTHSYLTATQLELALIVNFGGPSLSWKRVIRSRG